MLPKYRTMTKSDTLVGAGVILPRPHPGLVNVGHEIFTQNCPHTSSTSHLTRTIQQQLPCTALGPASTLPTFTLASLNTLLSDVKRSFQFLKSHPLLSNTSPPPPSTSSQLSLSHTFDFLPAPIQDKLAQISLTLHQNPQISNILDFVSSPRLEDPLYLTALAILLAAVFAIMSWFSRAGGSWGAGRFSPFGRSTANNGVADEVTDDNYSYITKEDLDRHEADSNSRRPEIVDWERGSGSHDTDTLVFKHGRTNFPAHFPAGVIESGRLRVGDVRAAAAKKLGVGDARRIRLFFKGNNLKVDERAARDVGLKGEGTGSEILCVVGEGSSSRDGMAPGSEIVGSEGEDDDDDGDGPEETGTGKKKRSRKRKGRGKKKGSAKDDAAPGLAYSNAQATPAEYLGTFNAPRPTPSPSSQPPISRTATPQTPLAKLDTLASKFHTEYVPLCITYMNNPPGDKAKRDFEYKKLSETILAQILLKLDGVEVEGDPEARARRKELVKEVQGMLNSLDKAVKEA